EQDRQRINQRGALICAEGDQNRPEQPEQEDEKRFVPSADPIRQNAGQRFAQDGGDPEQGHDVSRLDQGKVQPLIQVGIGPGGRSPGGPHGEETGQGQKEEIAVGKQPFHVLKEGTSRPVSFGFRRSLLQQEEGDQKADEGKETGGVEG